MLLEHGMAQCNLATSVSLLTLDILIMGLVEFKVEEVPYEKQISSTDERR